MRFLFLALPPLWLFGDHAKDFSGLQPCICFLELIQLKPDSQSFDPSAQAQFTWSHFLHTTYGKVIHWSYVFKLMVISSYGLIRISNIRAISINKPRKTDTGVPLQLDLRNISDFFHNFAREDSCGERRLSLWFCPPERPEADQQFQKTVRLLAN